MGRYLRRRGPDLERPVPVRVLFHRDFRAFSGGHLKVWHYFNHVLASPDHEPLIWFSPRSVWDDNNPWKGCPDRVVRRPERASADIIFLAGLDWLLVPPKELERADRPIINLVQHVRHADRADPRHRFLSHRAIRICVSEEVAEALLGTGEVNGPVFTIPNGLDLAELPTPRAAPERDVDVLVVANKDPEGGHRLLQRLRRPERRLQLVASSLPRPALLDLLARSVVTVFVPNRTEGFYLPALEGMALGTIVVCPDCVGNRSFCLPGRNCFRPPWSEDATVAAVEAAVRLDAASRESMLRRAAATATEHHLERERQSFLAILSRIRRLWEE